jgi:hypothetical protein
MLKYFILGLLFTNSLAAFSQAQVIITGRVLSEVGSPVQATISNGKNSFAANADGGYSFKVAKLPTELTYTAVGYQTYKLLVTEKLVSLGPVNIVMLSSRKQTAEVVVTGKVDKRTKTHTTTLTKGASTPEFETSRYEEAPSFTTTSEDVTVVAALPSRKAKMASNGLVGRVPGLFVTDASPGKNQTSNKEARLTAGEIDDFKKWNLWNDYTKDEFETFAKTFKVKLTNRYSVQLVNNDKQAIVNTIVQLIHQPTGKPVWAAITDNTGKAELWDIDGAYLATELQLKTANVSTNFPPTNFEQGINIITARQPCGSANEVDVSFIVDATGSMGDEIEFLKQELENVMFDVSKQHTTTQFRYSSIFYRDYSDEYVTKFQQFSEELLPIANFIKLQRAGGGGDYPEAVVPALQLGLDSLQWNTNAKARIAFLILDAPPHNGEEEKYKTLLQQYAAKGIRVIPVVCSGAQKSVEYLMRSLALATNGIYTFLTDHSGIGNSHMAPTTNEFKVQLLFDVMKNLINQMIYTTPCTASKREIKKENPFIAPTHNRANIKLMPNPTNGPITLLTESAINQVIISDFTGKAIQRHELKNNSKQYQFNIAAFPAGTYILQYRTVGGTWGSEKLVKIN